jgi:HEAT repeat protein
MRSQEDLILLELEAADLESPLDRLPPIEPESPHPDIEILLAQLRSSDVQSRTTATRAFCDLQDDRAIPDLIHLLGDECPLIRVSAAYALGRNPSPNVVEPLITQYHQDWNGYVRKGVVWALGNCRDSRALPTLIEAVRLDISAVRLWAASSLAQIAVLDFNEILLAIPPLIEGLRGDLVAAVRSNCAWSVGELCRELPSNVVYATAVDSLIEAFAEDPDLSVREDAKAAMLKLGDTRGLQVIEALEQEGWGL